MQEEVPRHTEFDTSEWLFVGMQVVSSVHMNMCKGLYTKWEAAMGTHSMTGADSTRVGRQKKYKKVVDHEGQLSQVVPSFPCLSC